MRTIAPVLLSVVLAAACTRMPTAAGEDYAARRDQMVEEQLVARDITDPRVLEAMRTVPRHLFVPAPMRPFAYSDRPLPIGNGQTISQPYIVALMTQLLKVGPAQKVLEIGTGSGYQAAVLYKLTPNVYTVEIVEDLYRYALERLARVGFPRDHVIHGDGYRGLPAEAPFDRIIVTAAPERIPSPLLEQLAPGGRMVVPVGAEAGIQQLVVVEKDDAGRIRKKEVLPVRFVPMTGESQKRR